MKFRTRLVLTLSTLTAVTVATASGAASVIVERSEERQLDEALHEEAAVEANDLANQHRHLSNRGGVAADDIGHLKKYAVVYASDGHVVESTSSFAKAVPPYESVKHAPGTPFNFWFGSVHLRGVIVEIPSPEKHVLLLAASRADMEKDTEFLRRVMFMVTLLSIGAAVLVTVRVVRRLTRGHEEIAEAARKVAAGDLATRVVLSSRDEEVVQLARDVDDVVRRLAILVEGQQRFVAHAAHELRSPLTALYGELQLALRRSRSAEEYRTAIEEALDSARRLKALAEDLLALARIGAERDVPHTPVALDAIVKNAATWVAQEARERSVSLGIDLGRAMVLGHAIDLERLVRNLLDNAIRHCPAGGEVRVHASAHGDMVHLLVTDDGPGVPIADRERIFDPFFRAATERQREGGSGLGLAIVREIARVHGGDVLVDDGPGGKGARFCVRLPIARWD